MGRSIISGSMVCRADASAQRGLGHFMRCLALGQAWVATGRNAVFLTSGNSAELRARIVGSHLDYVPVEAPYPSPKDAEMVVRVLKNLHQHKAFAAAQTKPWLVLDGYDFHPSYQATLREAGYRLLVIDDTSHWPQYHADILLNQNIGAEEMCYVCSEGAQLLLGTQYVLLRAEFLAWKGWDRVIAPEAHKLLVTLGGGDVQEATFKVICAMKKMKIPDAEIRLVVGPVGSGHDALHQAVHRAPFSVELLTHADAISELMAWADIAIIAGGSTCYEAAFMGLPAVILTIAPNQKTAAEKLARAGVALNLGPSADVSEDHLAEAVAMLARDSRRRREMSALGQSLVDGDGSARVIAKL